MSDMQPGRAYDDPLYRESIPHRIAPPPGTGRGPTACYLAAQRPETGEEDDAPMLTVIDGEVAS